MTRLHGESADAEKQLKAFIEKFEPKHQVLIRGTRKALRKRSPSATELVYDNYNFFVIGFGPIERPSDCIVSIAAAGNGVGLCFIHGVRLSDPAKCFSGRVSSPLHSPQFSSRAQAARGSSTSHRRRGAGEDSTTRKRPGKACDSFGFGQTAAAMQAAKGLPDDDAANRWPA